LSGSVDLVTTGNQTGLVNAVVERTNVIGNGQPLSVLLEMLKNFAFRLLWESPNRNLRILQCELTSFRPHIFVIDKDSAKGCSRSAIGDG
jgi:hypothetical protein